MRPDEKNTPSRETRYSRSVIGGLFGGLACGRLATFPNLLFIAETLFAAHLSQTSIAKLEALPNAMAIEKRVAAFACASLRRRIGAVSAASALLSINSGSEPARGKISRHSQFSFHEPLPAKVLFSESEKVVALSSNEKAPLAMASGARIMWVELLLQMLQRPPVMEALVARVVAAERGTAPFVRALAPDPHHSRPLGGHDVRRVERRHPGSTRASRSSRLIQHFSPPESCVFMRS